MSPEERLEAASTNLRDTYLSLGLAIEGADWFEDEGFLACFGPIDHPVCNFAVRLKLDPWSVGRLCDLAVGRGGFSIYSLPDDRPAHRGELLERQGFRVTYRMAMMMAEPRDPGPFPELRLAEEFADRSQVAEFMAGQFPGRRVTPFRSAISEATARASELELFDLWDRGQRVGAVMLSRSNGLIGVYNLCVAAARRGRGIGRSMVASLFAIAKNAGSPLSLQCDMGLVSWYEHLGFSRIGFVDVYSLDKPQWADIMG